MEDGKSGREGRLAWVFLALALGGLGCGNSGQKSREIAEASDGRVVGPRPSSSSTTLANAVRLAKTDPALSHALLPGPSWSRDAADLVKGADREMRVRLAARADLPSSVTPSSAPTYQLQFLRRGAASVSAREDAGRIVYENAFPSVDAFVVASSNRFEELLLLRTAEAPTEFSWNVTLPTPRSSVRPALGGLDFINDNGEPILHLPAPFAIDADGRRRGAEVTFDRGVLAIRLDRAGLKFPVLLDPILEQFLWVDATSGSTPPAVRRHAAMAFDSARSVTVLFGGTGSGFLGDTAEWNGSSWSSVCASGACGTGLTARSGARMAFDGTASILFGGHTGAGAATYRNEVYFRTSASTWTAATMTGGPPNARAYHGMAYDAAHGNVVVFGGNATNGVTTAAANDETWLLTRTGASTGTWTATCGGCVSGTSKPAARGHAAMAYAGGGKVLLFGGASYSSDTWEWDGGTLQWTQRCTGCVAGSTKPSGRAFASMAYDSTRNRVVLFGGFDSSQDLADTWEWNPVSLTWSQVTPSAGPTMRQAASAAFDVSRGRVVLFGGQDSAVGDHFQDTWLYHSRGGGNSSGGACTAGTQCDTGFCVDGVCCETSACAQCYSCDIHNAGQGFYPGVCNPVVAAQDDSAPTCNGANICTNSQTPVCKLDRGEDCTLGTQCATGNCKDGKCCDTSCAGNCKTCANASGTCTNVVSADDPDTCTGVNSCDASGNCRKENGQGCTLGTECITGICKDSHCCDVACSGTCKTCNNGSGTCSNVTSATDPDTCTGANSCDASGACKKVLGESCSGGTECVSGNCADSTCCESSCTTPCRSCANSGGLCNTTVTNQEDNNCNGTSSCDASGACKKDQGQTCMIDSDCVTGECADGRCCENSCATPCRSCGNPNGTCNTVVSGTLDDNCNGTSTCDASGSCKLAVGQACSGGNQCATGYCVEGFCCSGQCSGGCDVCSAANGASMDGQCTNLADGATGTGCGGYLCGGGASCPSMCNGDGDCATTHWCNNGSCVARSAQGGPCTAANQCLGSAPHCVDDVCCTDPCNGTCEACKASLKSSGADNGVCGPAIVGTDPHDNCAPDAQDTCDQTGQCDGAGQCQLFASGTACGATSCINGDVTGEICDGSGNCTTASSGVACAPYVCSGSACATPCNADNDCVNGYYCSGSNGSCIQKQDPGFACDDAHVCASGQCVDGVCCDNECDGACEACNLAGSVGTCSAVANAQPVAPRAACSGTGVCQGICDGSDREACSFPSSATECEAADCSGNSVVPAAKCDGAGECASVTPKNCGNYVCKAGACLTACSTNADCAAGATCDRNEDACVVIVATCRDAYSVEEPGGAITSCDGYRCVAGSCQQQCSDNEDCAPTFQCLGSSCMPEGPGSTGGNGGGGEGNASSSGGSGAMSAGGSSATGGTEGGAPSSTSGEGGETPTPPRGNTAAARNSSGCGCRVVAADDGAGAWLVAVSGLVVLSFRRRRREAA